MSEEISVLLKKINEKLDTVLENFNASAELKNEVEEDPRQTHFPWFNNTNPSEE